MMYNFNRTSIHNLDPAKLSMLYEEIPGIKQSNWGSYVDFEQAGRMGIMTIPLVGNYPNLASLRWGAIHYGLSIPACVAYALRKWGLDHEQSRYVTNTMYKEMML